MSIVIPPIDPDADVLTAALAYAKGGIYVGPVKAGTKDPASTLGRGWPQKTSTDAQVVAAWFAGTDHGVFLHAGRSGLLVFDVDHPDRLHPDIARAIEETRPPYQTTRATDTTRGHYLFATPPDRTLGNSLGPLASGWGEIRGLNGLIVAAPTRHKERAAGGLYRWRRTGPVPVLPAYLADQLPDALEAADAATDAQVDAFLDTHTASARPDLLDVHVRAFTKAVAAGESRHHTMTGHLSGAMKEAAAGLLDARTAADTLESLFLEAVAKPPTGKQGESRTGSWARSEWRGLLAWAVAQGKAANPEETRARVAERVPPVEDWVGSLPHRDQADLPHRDQADQPPSPDDTDEIARRLFPRLDWHELWADDSTEEWLHVPLLAARRSVVVYSPPKVGKSLLMLEFAVALSRGETFLGHQVERRIRVLYVDFENDPRGDIRSRLQAMGHGPDDLDHLDYLSFPTMAGLDTERGSVELLAAAHAYGSEVVIIDTISRAVAGEENSNDTWLGLYRQTGLKLKQAGVAVVRLDHTGKDETKGQRGGSAKSGDVDAVWRLTKITDERFRLECTDSRMVIETKSLHITRHRLPRLHHTAEVLGAMTDHEAKVAHLIELCDANGIPTDANRETVRAFAATRGIKVAARVVQDVIRHRKNAPNHMKTAKPSELCQEFTPSRRHLNPVESSPSSGAPDSANSEHETGERTPRVHPSSPPPGEPELSAAVRSTAEKFTPLSTNDLSPDLAATIADLGGKCPGCNRWICTCEAAS